MNEEQSAETTKPKYTDTGKTVTHRGKTYKILLPETHRDISPYVLQRRYNKFTTIRFSLTRNQLRPEYLFGIKHNGRMGVLPGWFTDKGGELKSLG